MRQPAEKINCTRAQELIEDFLDHELEGVLKQAFDDHVARCPSCAEETALGAQVKSSLRNMPRYETPQQVLRAVRRATTESPQAASTPHPWWRAGLGIAAAFLLAVVAIPLFMPSQSQAPSDAELERAVHEARYAFALVGKMSRTTGHKLRTEALTPHLATPTIHGLVGPLRKGLAHIPRKPSVQPSPTIS